VIGELYSLVGVMGESMYNSEKVRYLHIVLDGSGHEAGKQVAEVINQNSNAKDFYSSAKLDLKKTGFGDFDSLKASCEECCPGITDEIQGFADGLGTSPDRVPFWNGVYLTSLGMNCSQLAVLSSATKDHRIYAARSYEWTHREEDLALFTTREEGKAKHIGFSCMLFGRYEGLNEHGLIVSTTGGGIFGVPFKQKGPMNWLVVRSLLDQCNSVDNALKRLESMPMGGYFSLMLADRQDHAAMFEFADGRRGVRRITKDDPEPYVFSVNHFRQPETQEFNRLNRGIIRHSRIRESIITKWYEANAQRIGKQEIQNLFATEHPIGLCNHFYNEYFGTLWSMIFDVAQNSVDVYFSAPTHNEYRSFGLNDPIGVTEYQVTIPIKRGLV
jgi:predicted choloylglycine hydrolase